MFQWLAAFILQLLLDAACEHFAEFDAPLIERIDLPDCPLRKNTLLIKSDKGAEGVGCEALGKYRIGGTITLKTAMRAKPVRDTFGFDFIFRFSKSKRLGLGKQIRHEEFMVIA